MSCMMSPNSPLMNNPIIHVRVCAKNRTAAINTNHGGLDKEFVVADGLKQV